jgi:hypothetical protein
MYSFQTSQNRIGVQHSRLCFWKIIKLISKYIKRESFLEIADGLKIDRKTASVYGFLCRDRIIEEVMTNSQRLGGRDDLASRKSWKLTRVYSSVPSTIEANILLASGM